MNLAQFRAQHGGLENLTDREIVEYVARARGMTPENTPNYDKVIENSLGYDRTLVQAAGDTLLSLGQTAASIPELAGMGLGWAGERMGLDTSILDNPITSGAREVRQSLDQFRSDGGLAQRTDTVRNAEIARRRAEAEGAGFWGQIGAEFGSEVRDTVSNPGRAAEAVLSQGPMLAFSAGTGTLAQRGTRALADTLSRRGLSEAGRLTALQAQRAGRLGAVGGGSSLQGSSVASETYEELIKRGVPPEEAEEAAMRAGVRSGVLSFGLSLLPGASSMDTALMRGMGGRTGAGLASTARSVAGRGAVEGGTEALDEGGGKRLSNLEIQQVDPDFNPATGVGSAAGQGFVPGVTIGGASGLRRRALPTTETGEKDLTKPPVPTGPTVLENVQYTPTGEPAVDMAGLPPGEYDLGRGWRASIAESGTGAMWQEATPQAVPQPPGEGPVRPIDARGIDVPTWQRQGLTSDEVMTPVQQGPALLPNQPGIYVDPMGEAQVGGMPSEQDVAMRRYAPQAADPVQPAPQLPYDPTYFVDPTGTAQNFTPTEDEVLQRRYAPRPADPAPAAPQAEPVEQPAGIRTQLQEAAAEVRPTYLKKDGELTKTAEAAFAKILSAEDPATAIREAHQNGGGPRDEVLDTLHRILTGQTVFDWRAQSQANSAGFVSEPTEQLQAQADAVREGRKRAMVVGTDEVNRVNLAGVPQAIITDPVNGEQAVVASADPQLVAQTQARANEVGMRQALGEAQGVANPTLTSNPTPDSMTVQQVDNETGQVIGEEVITEQDIPNVREIPGTTARVVPNEQVIGDRVAAADAPLEAQPAEPAPAPAPQRRQRQRPPRFGRTSSEDLVQIVENDNSPDPTRYNEALYELYKRSAMDSDEGVAATYLAANPPTRAEQKQLAERFAPEKAELERKAAEREAKEGQRRGRKFGASFRAASEAPANPLSAGEIRSIIDDIKKVSPAAANVEFANSPADVGLDVPDGVIAEGVTLPDGRIVLFPGALGSRVEVERTVFHELFHRGLRAAMDRPQYNRTMANIAARDPRAFQYANQWKASTIGQQTRDMMADGRPLTGERLAHFEAIAVDEGLAKVAEALAADRLPGSKRGTIRNLAAWAASVADTLGLKNLAQWLRRQTYNDTEQFVMQMLERAGDPVNPPPHGGERFRGRDGVAGTLSQATTQTNRVAESEIKKRSVSENLLHAMSLRQIDEQYGKFLPAFRQWADALFERSSSATVLAGKADRIAQVWSKVKRADRENLADILLRASVAEISLDNTSKEYLDSLDAAQRAEHVALRSKLQALPENVRKLRSDALAVLREQGEKTRAAMENLITHTISDPATRDARIAEMREAFGRNRGDYFPLSRFGDTIVIARGAAKDGRDVVRFFEKESQAVAEVEHLRSRGVKNVEITRRTDQDFRSKTSNSFMNELHNTIDNTEMDGPSKEALHKALQELYLRSMPETSGAKNMMRRENIEGFSHDALRVFADAVTRGSTFASNLEYAPQVQAALESAQSQSRSSKSRQAAVVIGTKDGESPVVRVVPVGTSRLEAFDELTRQGYDAVFFNTVPESARESLAANLPDATDADLDGYVSQVSDVVGRTEEGVEDLRNSKILYNYMLGRQKLDASDSKWDTLADIGGQVGFFWYLGTSAAYWMMNALQNPMIALPQLSARYGAMKTAAEWGKAATWFTQVRMGKLFKDHSTPFSVDWLAQAVKDQKIGGVTQGDLAALKYLEDRQLIEFTRAQDLARVGSASNNKWTRAMRFAAAGAHHTEVFNRVTFGLTAYRLALKSDPSVTHEQAVKMAEKAMVDGHFDYSPTNSPDIMRGPTRLPLMFQKHRQHMLYWWVKQVKDAFKDEAPGVRKMARKSMLLMASAQLAYAGTLGMPFVGAIGLVANLIAAAGDDDDEPFDYEKWVDDAAKGFAVDMGLGEKAGAAFSKGIFAAMGMNISQRIGQADLMPFLNPGAARFENNADDKVRAYLFDMIGGPLGSMALNAGKSVEAFGRGHVAVGIGHVAPKAFADIAKAWDLGEKGLRNNRGDILAEAEEFDGWDRTLQALGVTPLKAADIRKTRGQRYEVERHLLDRGTALRTAFVEAWVRQDRDGMAEALESIHKYNRNLVKRFGSSPELVNSFGITKSKLESSVQNHITKQAWRRESGGAADSRRQYLLAMAMSRAMHAPPPAADPTWDKGWD